MTKEVDTLYFGGGTPTLFGGERLFEVIKAARENFGFSENAEITVEANPAEGLFDTFCTLKKAGVNRISFGVQSGVESELEMLGRRHKNSDVIKAVADAKKAGIDNISADLMIGIPNETLESLDKSIDFVLSLNVKHISVYMLKIEQNTPFWKMAEGLNLPDEDKTTDFYLHTVNRLSKEEFYQYEISNFAKKGYESRHNLKYWKLGDYLGLGPAAHSFTHGERFYFDRDFEGFLSGAEPIPDGKGGGKDEYIMLSLRLLEGLDEEILKNKYNSVLSEKYFNYKSRLIESGLAEETATGFRLTPKGFLVENTIVVDITEMV